MAKKLTFEEVKLRLREINPLITILSTEYKNSATKLKCFCEVDQTIWFASWDSLRGNHGCPVCGFNKIANDRKLTIEYVKNKIHEINPNILIVSDYYKNNMTKLDCLCLIDSHTWSATFSHLQNKRGCPECARRRMSGETSPRWKGGITEIGERLRRSAYLWKNDSKKACGFKCVISGERFDHIHHIYGFDMILEETFAETGMGKREKISDYSEDELKILEDACLKIHYKYGLGACLTKENHENFHQIYKYGQNTPEQWEEYLEMKRLEKAS